MSQSGKNCLWEKQGIVSREVVKSGGQIQGRSGYMRQVGELTVGQIR
jgi:hypothetical protein